MVKITTGEVLKISLKLMEGSKAKDSSVFLWLSAVFVAHEPAEPCLEIELLWYWVGFVADCLDRVVVAPSKPVLDFLTSISWIILEIASSTCCASSCGSALDRESYR